MNPNAIISVALMGYTKPIKVKKKDLLAHQFVEIQHELDSLSALNLPSTDSKCVDKDFY